MRLRGTSKNLEEFTYAAFLSGRSGVRIDPKKLAALEETMDLVAETPEDEDEPVWFDGKSIDEVTFCEAHLARHPMKCIHGKLYDLNGAVDTEKLENELYPEGKDLRERRRRGMGGALSPDSEKYGRDDRL